MPRSAPSNPRPIHSSNATRTTRVIWPGLLALILIVLAVLLANGLPQLARLVASRGSTAGVADAPAQTDIVYVSPQLPAGSRAGSCTPGSLYVPRADAWRCTVAGTVYDPCFCLLYTSRCV